MEWIDVKDRLPSNSGRYLCFGTYIKTIQITGKDSHHFKEIEDGMVSICQYKCANRPDWQWTFSAKSGRVTHWMPLPEIPKSKG